MERVGICLAVGMTNDTNDVYIYVYGGALFFPRVSSVISTSTPGWRPGPFPSDSSATYELNQMGIPSLAVKM